MFKTDDVSAKPAHVFYKALIMVSMLAVTLSLLWVVLPAEVHSNAVAQKITQNMAQSGVLNPVTAVLLNFRSYDTLLEIAVLLVVAIACMPMHRGTVHTHEPVITSSSVHSLVALLVPLITLVAGYMLWVGAFAPGGAFQAGALLASCGLLIILSRKFTFEFHTLTARICLVMGLTIFVGVGIMSQQSGLFLQYPVESAAGLILFIESAATLSIAATLLVCYLALAQANVRSNAPSAIQPMMQPAKVEQEK
ncbi:MAG: multisubunit Na+/H+ antiporter MnhB subunit [Paraglaciecola sp.]|jgi:multisubunit Na+/H+ antiporter MnhB subunit